MPRKMTIFIAVLLCFPAFSAAAPQGMNYQGFLTDYEGVPVNGSREIVFRIYNQVAGGSPLWTETQQIVAVTNGIFNVVLGSITPLTYPSQSLLRETLFLEVQVGGETLSPRRELTGAAYALASSKVVYGRVVTVAQDGGDVTSIYTALQMIASLSPAPSASDPYVIEVKSGVFNETNSISLPNYVSLRGSGQNSTIINLSAECDLTLGNSVTVEDLTINLLGSTSNISFANSTNSHIRRCTISGPSSPFYVNMQGTVGCSFKDNYLKYSGSGAVVYFLYIQTAQKALIQNNIIDIIGAPSATAIYAANITECVIIGNTIKFRGVTDSSYGIQINQNLSSSRISYNIFLGEIETPAGRDIYNNTTAAYPARPTHTGPYGIANHGSSGAELPAF